MLTDHHLSQMREAIAEIDDPVEILFYKTHYQGMERLAELQKQWQTHPDPELGQQIQSLIKKLRDSLDAIKPKETDL
jgi:hypothetical protein